MGTSTVKFTINFNDPTLDLEEREAEAQNFHNQLRQIDEVEAIDRVLDPNPPEGNKALGGILVGLLTAEVNATNTKAFCGFLRDRLSGKPIELEVEGNGKKLKVSASSRAELEAAIQAAQDFIAA